MTQPEHQDNLTESPQAWARKDAVAPRQVTWWRLAHKELRETLRDRRTIVTLVLMPLLVYPILSLVFRTFLFNTLSGGAGVDSLVKYRFAVQSEWPEETSLRLLQTLNEVALAEWSDEKPWMKEVLEAATDEGAADRLLKLPKGAVEAPLVLHDFLFQQLAEDPADMIRSGNADVVVQINGNPRTLRDVSFTIDYSEDIGISRKGAAFLREHIDLFNKVDLQNRLRERGRPDNLAFRVTPHNVEVKSPPGAVSFSSVIPLVLVLMTITGAVYPAIDLTAGERERGTLETLIATPVPKVRILIGKLVAVLVVAVLTASLNVVGMMSTVWAFQLDKILMGGTPLTIGVFFRIFGLLILFATFFSALLLVVTSFARSFKEAQAYLIPIILLSFAPGLIAMTPGLTLSGPLAVCPMINILLLARDILEGNAELVPASIAVFSTIVYAVAAIGLAASIFGADSILYGSQGSWREMFLRPLESVPVASVATAMLVLALLLPINFVSIALMQRLGSTVSRQLEFVILFTTIAFLVFPSLVAWHQRVRFPSGFGIRLPAPGLLLMGILIGLVAWPALFSLISLPHDLYDWFSQTKESDAARDRILQFSKDQIAELIKVPLWLYTLALAVVPAVCEEWFFRGLLLRSFIARGHALWAIAISAFAFGAFHTLSGSVVAFDRLLPTAIMGLILGWIAWRTNSIWPGVLLHMTHNASATLLARWATEKRLPAWMPDTNEPLPGIWTVGSVILAATLLVAVGWMTRRGTTTVGESTAQV